LKYLKILSK